VCVLVKSYSNFPCLFFSAEIANIHERLHNERIKLDIETTKRNGKYSILDLCKLLGFHFLFVRFADSCAYSQLIFRKSLHFQRP
jgi:hypothetical protein